MERNGKIYKIAGWGVAASGVGIAMLLVFFAVMGAFVFGAIPDFDLAAELELVHVASPLSVTERLVGVVFWSMTEMLGLWFCITALALFRGFRSAGVFTLDATMRLRRIGWIILALAPVSWLSELLGTMALSCLRNCASGLHGSDQRGVQATLSLEGADVYAIVIGVLIVAVGHTLVEAVRLNDENSAFV